MKKLLTVIVPLLILSGCYFENVIIEWEDGEIPYYYTGLFTGEGIAIIESAMREWESACGVKFEQVWPRSNAYEIIRTGKSNVWASSIGENNVRNHMY